MLPVCWSPAGILELWSSSQRLFFSGTWKGADGPNSRGDLVKWRSKAMTVEMDRKPVVSAVFTTLHHLCWSWVFLLVLFRSWTWRSSHRVCGALYFWISCPFQRLKLSGSHCPFTATLWLCYWGHCMSQPPACCDIFAFLGFVLSSRCSVIPVKPCIFKGFHKRNHHFCVVPSVCVVKNLSGIWPLRITACRIIFLWC